MSGAPVMPPVGRLLAIASCGVAGYFATATRTPPPSTPSVAVPIAKPPSLAENSLSTEWQQFRARHGDDTAAMALLYADVQSIEDVFRRRAFRSTLIAEWGAGDPAAALAWSQQNLKGLARIGEHAAALEWLATLPDPEARRTAIKPLEWDWIKDDPDGARDPIAGSLSDLVSPSMISSVAYYQAAKNPQAAIGKLRAPFSTAPNFPTSGGRNWMRR